MQDLQDKFAALGRALEAELVDREEEVRCALLALVAGCSFFMTGPPGVAKSMLARRLAMRISDAEYFEALLDRMATPEVLFGPWSLAAMRENRWERELTGTLATASLAHIDEVFSAGSALLQTLHWALNERIYRHGTTVIDLPLSTVFCSANLVPTDAGSAAFWDRLVLRRVLRAELDGGDFARMLRLELEAKPAPQLTWTDVQEAQVASTGVSVPDEVVDTVVRIRRRLSDDRVHPSPRRWRASMRVVQASAWLDGRSVATPTDLLVLKDILWIMPDQVTTVSQLVDRELRNALSPVVLLMRDVRKLGGQISGGTALPDRERLDLAAELGDKLQRAGRELDVLERRETSTTTRACRRLIDETQSSVLRELFRSDPDEVG